MKRVEVLVIGREILVGRTLDRNSNWIAKRLTGLGGMVKRIAVVDDVVDEIVRELRTGMANGSAWILTTGGLGPTHDDRTLDAVSLATGRPLRIDEEALRFVAGRYAHFAAKGMVEDSSMTPSREKMALLPEGARMLPNSVGAAPGVLLIEGGCSIASLPGVPSEMRAIFEEYLEEILKDSLRGAHWVERSVRTPLKDESVLSTMIDAVMKEVPGVYVKSRPTHFGKEVSIEVILSATGEDLESLQERLNRAAEALKRETDRLDSCGRIPQEKGTSIP